MFFPETAGPINIQVKNMLHQENTFGLGQLKWNFSKSKIFHSNIYWPLGPAESGAVSGKHVRVRVATFFVKLYLQMTPFKPFKWKLYSNNPSSLQITPFKPFKWKLYLQMTPFKPFKWAKNCIFKWAKSIWRKVLQDKLAMPTSFFISKRNSKRHDVIVCLYICSFSSPSHRSVQFNPALLDSPQLVRLLQLGGWCWFEPLWSSSRFCPLSSMLRPIVFEYLEATRNDSQSLSPPVERCVSRCATVDVWFYFVVAWCSLAWITSPSIILWYFPRSKSVFRSP